MRQIIAQPATRHSWLIALVLCLAAAGCGGGKGVNGPIGGSSNFTATIDGQAWAAASVGAAAQGVAGVPGGLVVSGAQVSGSSTLALGITLYNVKGAGTYALGVSPAMYGGFATLAGPAGGWGTDQSGMSGSVVITALTSTHVTGTFAFVAPPTSAGGGPGTRTVTNGKFDLPLAVPVPAVPNDKGATVTATINGVPYAAWIALETLKGASGVGFSSSNTDYALSVYLQGVTAIGTYTPSSLRQVVVTHTSGAGSPTWGAQAADSGSIHVTSLTAKRVKGTFNLKLGAAPGNGGSDIPVSGTFDVGTP